MKTFMTAGSALLLAYSSFAAAQSDPEYHVISATDNQVISAPENQIISDSSELALPGFLQTSPIYRNGVLTIPEGTMIDSEGTHAFRDIVLVQQDDGRFALVESNAGELAHVEEVTITEGEEDTVNVNVKGTKSTPCVELLPPAMSMEGKELTIVLPLSRPTSEACILMIESFETDISLPTDGLEPGVYTVTVNGEEATYTVE